MLNQLHRCLSGTILLLLLAMMGACTHVDPQNHAQHDLVIEGGRVIDPLSGLDAIRNLGIRDGRIVAISEAPLPGRNRVDAEGLVVSPGFIDIHAHGSDQENYDLYALAGVTTALELEDGTAAVNEWYSSREGKARINFGVSAGHYQVRQAVMDDETWTSYQEAIKGDTIVNVGTYAPTGSAANDSATEEQIEAMRDMLQQGLEEGAIAVGMGIGYTPGASLKEVVDIFQVAADNGATIHPHLRFTGLTDPNSSFFSVEEAVAAAAITGASLHIVHLNSTGLSNGPELLDWVSRLQDRGFDISTAVYPYGAAMTNIGSAMFEPGWRESQGLDYGDLMWPQTGERLTEETFDKYREQGGLVIVFNVPQEDVDVMVASERTMIISDGLIQNGKGHPRMIGTWPRILGIYVREKETMTLVEGLRKMSLMPAQRLERYAPDMKRKGRIQIGADADLTLFDPATVVDNATYTSPIAQATGIPHVIVGGELVVRDGKLVKEARPGQAVRNPPNVHQRRETSQ